MTEKPLTANPEDRPVPPEGHHLTRAVAAARIAAASGPEPVPVPAPNTDPAPGGSSAATAGRAAAEQAAEAGPEADPKGPDRLGADRDAAPDGGTPAAPAGVHTRPIRPMRTRTGGQPLAWSGFLLGGLALVFAIALTVLLWRFAGEERAAPGPVATLPTEDLLEMETLLDQLGFPPGPPDGVIDAESLAAIRDFQLTAGLPVDGEPSPLLLEELRAALAELTGAAD